MGSPPPPPPSIAARCFTANSVVYCSLSPHHPKSMVPAPSPLTDSYLLHFLIGFSAVSSMMLLLFSLLAWWRRRRRLAMDTPKPDETDPKLSNTMDISSMSALKLYLSKISDKSDHISGQNKPTHISQSLLIELLTSNSPNWSSLLLPPDSVVKSTELNDSRPVDGEMSGEEPEGKKRKKKNGKKKKNKQQSSVDSKTNEDGEEMRVGEEQQKKNLNDGLTLTSKEDLVCLYPFTSSSSATQRRIKQYYDQLVKSHDSKGLTMAQVGQFVDSLVDARNELEQKSEVVRRKFTITKALLLRADRSSFDRLRQQLYKLEAEQKRLDEDAFVYNWLQNQLKLSPAYKKMLETNASKEMEAKSTEPTDKAESETEFSDISFEELLAQEKKDSFWQKHSKQRLSSFS